MDLDAAAGDYRRALDGVEQAKRAAKRRVDAARAYADAARAYADAARDTLHAAIVEAAQDGVRQIEIVRRTGYTPERVRQILRAAGVLPD